MAFKGPKGSNPFVSAPPSWRAPASPPEAILVVAVLDGGLGVPYTGNPRHAGLNTRLRPLKDRAVPGKQR